MPSALQLLSLLKQSSWPLTRFATWSRGVSLRLTSFLILLAFFNGSLPAQPEKEIDWKEEINLFGKELAARHMNLFFKTDSVTFFRALDRIIAESEGQSVFPVSIRLQQVVAGLGDAHTLINYHYRIDKQFILPIDCYWFEDGLYILRTRMEYPGLAGKKIRAINQTPLQQVIDSLSTLISGINPALAKNHIPRMITWVQLLQYFGFAETSRLEILLEDSGGDTLRQMIELPARESSMIRMEPDCLPLGWQDKNSYFRDQYLPEERLYYIQYNKCWSRETEKLSGSGASALFMPSFKEFEKRVLQIIRKEEPDKLVFDIRFNAGGNSMQGTRFINKLARTKIGERAEVFLVVGRATFSSAIINAVDFINAFDAVTVGENTGGKPNHYGEVNRFVLPQSGLVVNYSTKYFKIADGDPPSILPEIQTPETYTGFMKGIDPAMEAILHYSAE